MAEPFVRLMAVAAPLPWSDVNTDDIFPGPGASPVARRAGAGDVFRDRALMGENAFAAHRWLPDGSPDPDFVLNRRPFDQARILVTGANFGCGSSREMAVWCLTAIGLRCIIAPSFADIFYGNCMRNGLLPVRVPEGDVAHILRLLAEQPGTEVDVDLTTCTLTVPDEPPISFVIGDYHRHLLLNGLDEISATLERMDDIEAHELSYHAARPWLAL